MFKNRCFKTDNLISRVKLFFQSVQISIQKNNWLTAIIEGENSDLKTHDTLC